MFRTLSLVTLLASALSLTACAGGAPTIPTGEKIGEALQAHEIKTLSTVQKAPTDHFEQTIFVEATIKDVCQTKGCWMAIEDGGQPTLVRWETGCGGKYAFPKDAVGERVLVQGSFYPKELSEADAEHMAEEAGHDLDMPSKLYEMNASAVVMLERK